MSRRVGTREGLGERRSAGLSRAGWRFARWTNTLENRNRRLRLRFTDENRSEGGQEKNGESRGTGSFRRSCKRQRVVRRRVRRVMVVVVVMVAIIMVVVMQVSIRDRRH